MDSNDLSLLWCKQYIDKRLKGIGNVDTSIKPGSVGTAELADGSVTLLKLAQEVLELFYQPGSLYINANNINPRELFGFGEWVQIKDRFILAAGDTYPAGSTGGEATHTLTVNEMPSHYHAIYMGRATLNPAGIWGVYDVQELTNTSNNRTEYAGGGAAHNNMPPYQAFYVWMRVS